MDQQDEPDAADERLTAPIVRPSKGLSIGMRNPANAIPGRAIPEALQAGAFTMADLPRACCKWPMAMAGGERTFCGQPRADGDQRYCAPHAKRSGPTGEYSKIAQAERAGLENLLRKGKL